MMVQIDTLSGLIIIRTHYYMPFSFYKANLDLINNIINEPCVVVAYLQMFKLEDILEGETARSAEDVDGSPMRIHGCKL